MKYMKNLKKALGPLVDYLEESMAQYVESQDRIRSRSARKCKVAG